MVNPLRGEVEIMLNDVPHVARLTLGALAELEAELATDSLVALVERFESGAFKSADVLTLILAGLRGAGWTGTRADLIAVDIAGGPMGAARDAALLIGRAFAAPE